MSDKKNEKRWQVIADQISKRMSDRKSEIKYLSNDRSPDLSLILALAMKDVKIYNYDEGYTIIDGKHIKLCRSPNYNYNFNKVNGYFETWGKTKDEDVDYCEFGPNILDFEVTTICHGITGKDGNKHVCQFCYKSNTPNGENLSFDKFKACIDKILEKRVICQIAFGADSSLTSNPDFWKMVDYCRNNPFTEIVPNVTLASLEDEETAKNLKKYMGACAVSLYPTRDKNVCYDAVKKLSQDYGMSQINIHYCVAYETKDFLLDEFIHDVKNDPRLSKLNCIVLLSLKQRGRGVSCHTLNDNEFKEIIDVFFKENIRFGMDSCSAPKFLKAIAERPDKENIEKCVMACEATCESAYIDVHGVYTPCSFCPGCKGEGFDWDNGIDVSKSGDFIKDVWNNPCVIAFRKKLISQGRSCPVFSV